MMASDTVNREPLETALDAFRDACAAHVFDSSVVANARQAVLHAARCSPAQVEGEAVAYRWRRHDAEEWQLTKWAPKNDEGNGVVEALGVLSTPLQAGGGSEEDIAAAAKHQPQTFLGARGLFAANLLMRDLYKIVRDRLEYMGENYDPDAVTQNVCVEVEKKMGVYPRLPPAGRDAK